MAGRAGWWKGFWARLTGPDSDGPGNQRAVPNFLWYLTGSGAVVVVLFSWSASLTSAAVALLVAGAAFVGGLALGFLFGIPKRSQPDGQNPGGPYSGNSSLEQISDWLTKIIVGATITQIPTIGSAIGNASGAVARDVGHPDLVAFGASILVFFALAGFLIGYLWARIRLPKAFTQAESEAAASSKARVTLENVAEEAILDLAIKKAAEAVKPEEVQEQAAQKAADAVNPEDLTKQAAQIVADKPR
jgi:ABC-type amino acid transport system permease subunit